MLYGEHISAEEEDPHCGTCTRPATVEVFAPNGQSCGYYCKRCGKRKLEAFRLPKAHAKIW